MKSEINTSASENQSKLWCNICRSTDWRDIHFPLSFFVQVHYKIPECCFFSKQHIGAVAETQHFCPAQPPSFNSWIRKFFFLNLFVYIHFVFTIGSWQEKGSTSEDGQVYTRLHFMGSSQKRNKRSRSSFISIQRNVQKLRQEQSSSSPGSNSQQTPEAALRFSTCISPNAVFRSSRHGSRESGYILPDFSQAFAAESNCTHEHEYRQSGRGSGPPPENSRLHQP